MKTPYTIKLKIDTTAVKDYAAMVNAGLLPFPSKEEAKQTAHSLLIVTRA